MLRIVRHIPIAVLAPFIAAGALLLTSCGSSTEPEDTSNTMSALVDRVRVEAIEVSAGRENGRIVLQGISAIGATIDIEIVGDSTGTYPLGEGLHTAVFTDEFVSWEATGVNAGSVTITEIDDTGVRGYFGFRGKDPTGSEPPRVIANGRFDITFSG